MDNKLKKLDGRHRLAVVMALVTLGISIFFSKEGFGVGNPNAQWLGWILAAIVTTMEIIFNSRTQKVPLTLISIGLICYAYGVWTNVIGFWTYQHPGIDFQLMKQESIMSVFVGLILEVLPEPLFLWGIGAEIEGDLLGNLLGLVNGDLEYAKPSKNESQPQLRNFVPHPHKNDTVSNQNQKQKYVAPINPKWQHNQQQKRGGGDPRKVVSNLFLDSYTKKYKGNK